MVKGSFSNWAGRETFETSSFSRERNDFSFKILSEKGKNLSMIRLQCRHTDKKWKYVNPDPIALEAFINPYPLYSIPFSTWRYWRSFLQLISPGWILFSSGSPTPSNRTPRHPYVQHQIILLVLINQRLNHFTFIPLILLLISHSYTPWRSYWSFPYSLCVSLLDRASCLP